MLSASGPPVPARGESGSLALGQPNWFMKFGMTCAAAAAGQARGSCKSKRSSGGSWRSRGGNGCRRRSRTGRGR